MSLNLITSQAFSSPLKSSVAVHLEDNGRAEKQPGILVPAHELCHFRPREVLQASGLFEFEQHFLPPRQQETITHFLFLPCNPCRNLQISRKMQRVQKGTAYEAGWNKSATVL